MASFSMMLYLPRSERRYRETQERTQPISHLHLISRSLSLAIFAIWEKLRNLILAK